ncbi:predicted protein [Botrytis cinerea T4]|uniref:Uncharacterized protein n=1 Tax=Botryotinia fuckeliana (strain T4) TaxID=999810 RepID=G2Y4I9_BOTF4|nr:predicted protein [Botrytis cinerea T4]
MSKNKGKRQTKATGSSSISYPGLKKKMASQAGVKKPMSKNIYIKNSNKRIKTISTLLFPETSS